MKKKDTPVDRLRNALTESYKEAESKRTGNLDFYGLFDELNNMFMFHDKYTFNALYESVISCAYIDMLGTDIISPEHTLENLAKVISEMDLTDRIKISQYVSLVYVDYNDIYEYLRNVKNSIITQHIKKYIADHAIWSEYSNTYINS